MAVDNQYEFELSENDPFKNVYSQRADSFRVFLYELGIVGSEANWRINQIFSDWLLTHRLNNYFLRIDSTSRDFFEQGTHWATEISQIESRYATKIAESIPALCSILFDISQQQLLNYFSKNKNEYRYLTLFMLCLVSGKDKYEAKFDATLCRTLKIQPDDVLDFNELFIKSVRVANKIKQSEAIAEV